MSRQPFGTGKPLGIVEESAASLYEPFYVTSKTSRPGMGPRHRSSSPGIFGKIGLAQPTLQISLAQDVFFLHPAPEGVPTDDEIVQGTVTLWLPKPRSLKHLTVRLVGLYDIGWNDSTPYESGVCLEKTVALFRDGEVVELEKGEHTFEFIIIVPSQTACYERCQYGRVRHTITAKAKGLGNMGGDVMSNEKPVFLITNPGLEDVSKPPPPLHLKFEGSLDEIGPYTMAMQSQHIMVGGLLLFRLSLLFPPRDLYIYSIKVKIVQQFHLKSPQDASHESAPPPHAQTVFILDSAHPPNMAKVQDNNLGGRSGSQTPRFGPLKVLKKDEMWKIHHLARLPNDNHIRPTTHEGTVTPISVTHSIQMELTFRRLTEEESYPSGEGVSSGSLSKKGKEKEKEPERRKVVMSKPLDIFSCCCFLDSLTLPVYSLLDPNPVPLDAEMCLPCVCGMNLKQLIENHATALLVEGDDDAHIEYIGPPKTEGSSGRGDDSQPQTPVEERGRPERRESEGRGGFFRNVSGDRLFAMAGWRAPSNSNRTRPGSGPNSANNSQPGSRSASSTR
ncbi:hypothetical protein JCM21900_001018 [Sporobolomyces salmonicolor]